MYSEALTMSGFNNDIIYTPVIDCNNSEGNKTDQEKKI